MLPTQKDLASSRSDWTLSGNRTEISEPDAQEPPTVHSWLRSDHARATSRQLNDLGWSLGLDRARRPMPPIEVHSVRPARRVGPDGQRLTDLVIEITQSRPGYLDPDEQKRADREPPARRRARRAHVRLRVPRWLHVIVSMENGEIRYASPRTSRASHASRRQRAFIDSIGSVQATYFSQGPHRPLREPFAMLHRSGAAFDAGVNL